MNTANRLINIFQNIKKNMKKGFTLVEILFAVALTAAATVSIGAILVSTQNNTTKMFTQGELQQQTAEFQETFRNELLQTNFGMRYWVRQDESSPLVETLTHSGDCYEKIVACYSFDRVDYKLTKTYYKFNSEKGMIETAVLTSDMKDYKEFDNDIIIKIDGDINATLAKIPNWTVKATSVEKFNIDLSQYADHDLVEYSLMFEDDNEEYPTNDAVHLRSAININNDLTVESSKQHIAISKPYISGDSIFLYDGYRKRPNVVNVDPRLTILNPENLYGTDPGLYTITFQLPAEEGFMWEDGSEGNFSLQWYITSSAGETTFGEESYVIWTASDKTLRFYKNSDHPTENNEYNGKMVTKKWTNIEEINATRPGGVPWVSMLYTQVEYVEIIDEICPQSTAFWFYNLKNCKEIKNLENINGELISSTKSMFENCGTNSGEQVEVDLSHWDASNTFDMSRMFYNAFPNTLETIYTPVNIPAGATQTNITNKTWYSLTTGETFDVGTFPRGCDFSHFLTSIDPTANYTLRHWQQNVDGNVNTENSTNYTLAMTETHTAFSRMNIYPPAQTFVGFGDSRQKGQPFVIQKDGTTVIDYYYPRLLYNVTTIPGYGVDSTSGDGSYLFGATVSLNATMKPGYSWYNWTGYETNTEKQYQFVIDAHNREYTANGKVITYNITYNMNGGTEASGNPTTYNVESAPIVLKNPTKMGYDFAGWTGSNGTTPNANLTIPTGTVGNLSYTASWTPSTNTKYTVKHYKQNLDNTYTLYETDTLYGTTDSSVTPARKSYDGFKSPSGQTKTVLYDGSQVFEYKYDRQSYTLTLSKGTGIASVSGAGTYKYGASVTINATLSTEHEYQWNKWTGDKTSTTQKYTFTMPAKNTSITANATEIVSFAIYSATDSSLRFYRSTSVPAQGSTYNSKAVTAIYKRVNELKATSATGVPWYSSYATKIKTVSIEHENIKPVSTAYWFNGCSYMTTGSFAKLNMSKCTDMAYMFGGAGNLTSSIKLSGLENWDTSNVISMYGVFGGMGYYRTAQTTTTTVVIGDLSRWNTSKVTTMNRMFSDTACFSAFNVGNIGNWDTSNVTDMSFMFNACGKMVGSSVGANTWYVGDISKWNVSKVKDFSFMFNEVAKYNSRATVPTNLSKWNTSSATNMRYMFPYAWSYMSYSQNLSGWNVDKVTTHDVFNDAVTGKVTAPRWKY